MGTLKSIRFGMVPSMCIGVMILNIAILPVTSYYSADMSSPSLLSGLNAESSSDVTHYSNHPRTPQPPSNTHSQRLLGFELNSDFLPHTKEKQSYSHHHFHQSHNHHHHHHNHHAHHFHNQQEDPSTSTEDYNHHLQQEEQPQQHDGPYFNSHMSTNKYGQSKVGNCRLPDSWKGRWFQSGSPNPILIDSKFIEGKGTCYESAGDKFLFVEKKTCYRCLVINERHRNVLEYKESSFCEEKDTLENLCIQIPGDAQLYSLFRIDAQPIDCPFKGPFLFSYNRGHGVCKSPMSRVDVCTEPSKLLLKYQACPDVPRTESTSEELQCLAEWREGAYHYLVSKLNYKLAASNEDRYRCFIFERTKGHMIKIAESGDATCIGLSSPMEGARTMTFQKIHETGTKCKFPAWVVMHQWHSIDKKLILRTNHKNSTISVSSEDKHWEQYYGINHNQFGSIQGAYTGAFTSNAFGKFPVIRDTSHMFLADGSKIQCQNRVDLNEDHVAITAHHTHGCTSSIVCMHIHRRDADVIEIRFREKGKAYFDDFECGSVDAMGTNVAYVTLINSEETSRRCPYLGKYMTTSITQDGRLISTPSIQTDPCATIATHHSTSGFGSETSIVHHHHGSFHSLVVGCGHKATMDFHSKCLPHEPITSYECLGSWDENGLGFLIASPTSTSSAINRRYCFSYAETDEGLQVFSSSETCVRDPTPSMENIWAFNLTVDGQCAEPVTTGGGVGRVFPSGNAFLLMILANILITYPIWIIVRWMEEVQSIILFLLTSSIPIAKEVKKALQTGGVGILCGTVPFIQSQAFRSISQIISFLPFKHELSSDVKNPISNSNTSNFEDFDGGGTRSPQVSRNIKESGECDKVYEPLKFVQS